MLSAHADPQMKQQEPRMPHDLPERIRLNGEAARIPLSAEALARVARAVTLPLDRLAQTKLAIPLEVEPSTFAIVQRGEIAE
jgi:hypothetical protein